MTEVFIAGCGDIGLRIAARCAGRRVGGLVRRPQHAQLLRDAGIQPLLTDLDAQKPELSGLDNAWVFYLAPPPKQGDDDPRQRHFLDALPAARALIYLSTSAVYGDCQGAWVDETAPLNPGTPRGRRRAAAERSAQDWGTARGVPVMILRVPGIYGPGRLPVERLKKGLPVLRETESPWIKSPWINRIHAEDLAAAALFVVEHGQPGTAYNVSDGNPTSMTDYFNRCADLLGLPRPPQISVAEARTQLTPEMLSFLEESKKLDTRRLRALGWTPRYPTLSEGLPACL